MGNKVKGKIVKGIAGFYYVKAGNTVYQCKARGIFKKLGIVPTVGDIAKIEVQPDGDALIFEIELPRKNIFVRPAISNVDCFVVIFAAADPVPNLRIIDRFLVMAEKSHADIILCINKIDMGSKEDIEKIENIYKDVYPVCCVSAVTGEGLERLKELMKDKACAFAGPSGAGKSTLLNFLNPLAFAETGEVSQKTGRGKHTTRHTEIFDMQYGGEVFDTPGFTSFDILESTEEELQHLYPEFEPFLGKCRYDNCKHLREPECAVRNAVTQGDIQKERFISYAGQLLEIQENERNKYQ